MNARKQSEHIVVLHATNPRKNGTALFKSESLRRHIEESLNDAATRMRDRCVEKVREMHKDWKTEADARRDPDNPHDYKGSYGLASGAVDACDDIITALESLTPQGEQEK